MTTTLRVIKQKKSPTNAEVCVLLTSFNYSAYIIEALDSIKSQTIIELDIVVIDDCSSDNSVKKIRAWFNKNGYRFNSFTLLQNITNQGAACSRNNALMYIKNNFVFMMDSDNTIYPTCIQKLLKAIHVSHCEFVYPILERFGNETRLINLTPWKPELLYYGNYVDNMALFKTDVLEAVGGYTKLETKGPEDYELFVKLAARGVHGGHVPEILARYRIHGSSVMDSINKAGPDLFVLYLREKYKVFFDRILKEEPIHESISFVVEKKQSLIHRSLWALGNPLKFFKKHIVQKIPSRHQIFWVIFHPKAFLKKYIFTSRHMYQPVVSLELQDQGQSALRTVYFISNVTDGGSRKYLLDLVKSFEGPSIRFVQIRNKADIESHRDSFKENDLLIFQYVLFSDIAFDDIVNLKKRYLLKLIIPVHDFYFFGTQPSHFYKFNEGIHSNYKYIERIRGDVVMLLESADIVIYPSNFVKNNFDARYVLNNTVVSNHIDYQLYDFLYIPKIKQVINIGIINNITSDKGAQDYPKLFHSTEHKGYRINYHIFGASNVESPNVHFHGPYAEGEIFSLLKQYDIHGLVFLNTQGETYGYALTKGINSGLPILYSNIGSYTERLENNKKFFSLDDVGDIKSRAGDMFDFILEYSGKLEGVVPNHMDIDVPQVYQELFSLDYEALFQSYHKKHELDYEKLFNTVEPYAIYFPQFHALAENTKTFYEGYHDMVNLEKAKKSHAYLETPLQDYLRYYNLETDRDVVPKQILLAQTFGFKGFGIYYYWFSHNSITGDHMLMNKVIDRFFEQELSGFDVFFIYANESWTDNPAFNQGTNEHQVKNEYTQETITKNFENLLRYFKHTNYKKVDNKPVLFLHHPWEMNNKEFELFFTIGNEMMKRQGFTGLELVVNAIGGTYTGHKHYDHHPDYKTNASFTSLEQGVRYIDYQKYTDEYLVSSLSRKNNIQTVFYNFNNTVRYFNHKNKDTLITKTKNNTISYFKKFLRSQLDTYISREHGEKILLMNSWNEWGEQMGLEPSNESGFRLLNAWSETVIDYVKNKKQYNEVQTAIGRKKILYVGHDAGLYGAQLLSLYIVKELREHYNFDVHFILKSGGILEKEYREYATVYNLAELCATKEKQEKLVRQIKSYGIQHAIVNTVVCGDILEMIRKAGMKTVALVHELPGTIKQYGIESNAKIIAEQSSHIIFPSHFVKNKFSENVPLPRKKTSVMPQGLYRENIFKNTREVARETLRNKLCLSHDAQIVLGVGSGNRRKGIDLFVHVAHMTQYQKVHFVWIGDIDPALQEEIDIIFQKCNNLTLLPSMSEIALFYAGADVYLLPSREDPFPSVVLESMSVGVPVIGFENAGGFVDVVTPDTGILVPLEDIYSMARVLKELLDDDERRTKLGNASRELIEQKFSFHTYVEYILKQLGIKKRKVNILDYVTGLLQRFFGIRK